MRHRRFFFNRHTLLSALFAGWLVLAHGAALAQAQDVFTPRTGGQQHSARPPNALYVHNRHIVTFRATLLGDSPADRVALARAAFTASLQGNGRTEVTRSATPDSVRFELNGRTVFFLVPDDVGGPRPDSALEARSREVLAQLEKAAAEAVELRDHLRIASDLAICLGATLLAWLLVSATLLMRVHTARRLHAALHRPAAARTSRLATFSEHTHVVCRLVTNAVALALVLLIVDTWASFVLLQFAWTRPWGEQSSTWLMEVLRHFASATAAAVPGLVVAGLIFVIAHMVSRANVAFMHRVQRGEIQLAWLDAHTAQATRRVCDTVLWLFAVAMAYPYLPGAETEAFKALSVMAGLMLSLGASSAVGQALSGLSLMYSHSLRVGQRVKIGDTEGTVVALGMFTTRLRTPGGDDVYLPNKRIVRRPILHLPDSTAAPDQSP